MDKNKIFSKINKLDKENIINYLIDCEIINENNYEDIYYEIDSYDHLDHKDYEGIGINKTHELYKKRIKELKQSLLKYPKDEIHIDDIFCEINEHFFKF